MEGIRACVRHPGLRVGAFRRTYGELKESLLAELANYGFAQSLGASWNGTEFELRWPSGSLIMFRYAESLKDATRRQGGQYQLLIFDERTLFSPDVVAFLESRLRSGRADIPVLGIRSSANPGGPGHGAVRTRYIDPTQYGDRIIKDERGRTVRFIPSKLADNPHVNPEYAADLLALPEQQRAAFLDGNWDAFAGAMFPELSRRHVVPPISLPESWRRYNGIDWGYAAPWCVLWAAVDEDGRVWVYREIYERQVGESEQARRILAAEADGEAVTARYADDAMQATRGDAKPISECYADEGVHLTPAGKGPGSRVNGWQRVHTYLADMPACPHHRAQGWDTCPRLHIFTTVTELYRELRDLPHASRGDVEDADSNADDHACLVAGTMVATATGAVPIEQVAVDDFVWTRRGLRRVVSAGMTARAAQVGTVRMSNGAVLRGTANHPVWVTGKGWTRLDALRYSDKIETWREEKLSCSTGSPSGAIRILSAGPTVSTSLRGSLTSSADSTDFTKRFGKPRTARSQTATTSTTRMRTRSTTRWTTWSASRAPIISLTTRPSGITEPLSGSHTWTRSVRLLLHGIAPRKVEPGIVSMANSPSPSVSRFNGFATSAATSSAQWDDAQLTASARTTASTDGGSPRAWMTRPAAALSVAPSFGSTSTSRRSAAPAHVLARWCADRSSQDVYNLTVEGAHEFYANGVLVHNCDALRYLLINLGNEPRFFFPSSGDTPTTLVPTATGRHEEQRTHVPSIGGFPILQGGDPWG